MCPPLMILMISSRISWITLIKSAAPDERTFLIIAPILSLYASKSLAITWPNLPCFFKYAINFSHNSLIPFSISSSSNSSSMCPPLMILMISSRISWITLIKSAAPDERTFLIIAPILSLYAFKSLAITFPNLPCFSRYAINLSHNSLIPFSISSSFNSCSRCPPFMILMISSPTSLIILIKLAPSAASTFFIIAPILSLYLSRSFAIKFPNLPWVRRKAKIFSQSSLIPFSSSFVSSKSIASSKAIVAITLVAVSSLSTNLSSCSLTCIIAAFASSTVMNLLFTAREIRKVTILSILSACALLKWSGTLITILDLLPKLTVISAKTTAVESLAKSSLISSRKGSSETSNFLVTSLSSSPRNSFFAVSPWTCVILLEFISLSIILLAIL